MPVLVFWPFVLKNRRLGFKNFIPFVIAVPQLSSLASVRSSQSTLFCHSVACKIYKRSKNLSFMVTVLDHHLPCEATNFMKYIFCTINKRVDI